MTNTTMRSKEFIFGEEIPWEKVGEGMYRQILGYDDKILMARVKFEKGGIGTVHEHFHSQTTYVISGKFELQVGKEKKILNGGDAFYIPPHIDHGAICLEAGELIDVFSPSREDFFKK